MVEMKYTAWVEEIIDCADGTYLRLSFDWKGKDDKRRILEQTLRLIDDYNAEDLSDGDVSPRIKLPCELSIMLNTEGIPAHGLDVKIFKLWASRDRKRGNLIYDAS